MSTFLSSIFCPNLRFFHLTFYPIRHFFFGRFVRRLFFLRCFVGESLCQVCGAVWSKFSEPLRIGLFCAYSSSFFQPGAPCLCRALSSWRAWTLSWPKFTNRYLSITLLECPRDPTLYCTGPLRGSLRRFSMLWCRFWLLTRTTNYLVQTFRLPALH